MIGDPLEQVALDEEKANEKARGKLNRIRGTNAGIVQEIESMGQEMDVTLPRLEHFMVYLVQLGIITESQLLEEGILWEKNLKEQLVPVVRGMREQRELARQEARRRQAAAATASGKPAPTLILPAGVSREASKPAGETENSS